MPSISVDVSSFLTSIEIRLNQCPESVSSFISSLVSSRYVPSSNSFAIHAREFKYLKDYLDSVGIHDRDASEEAIERVIDWNKAQDLEFRLKSGEYNSDVRPEFLSSVKTKLYPDQITGVRYLTSRHGTLLADSMGIGKSLQAISSFAVWKSLGVVSRALVVAISGVKPGWMKEIKKHSSFSVSVLPNGTDAILEAIEQYKQNPTDFLIVHYEGICQPPQRKGRPDIDRESGNSEVIEALLQRPFDVVFDDEAHLLKNMDTGRYKSFAYLLSRINTTEPQVEVEYLTEFGEIVKRVVTSSAALHLDEGDEVEIL